MPPTETPEGAEGLASDVVALIDRYPLPPGVPDATVNKAQLAEALGVSEVTVSNWLRRGLPAEEAGTNGRSYQFRLAVAYAWKCAREAEDRARSAEAEAAAQQLRLALVGDEGPPELQGLSVREQTQVLELKRVRNLTALEQGELMRRAEVIAGFEEAFAAIRDALDALPDRLARELGIEGRDLERVEVACDDALRGAAVKIEGLIGKDDAQTIPGRTAPALRAD